MNSFTWGALIISTFFTELLVLNAYCDNIEVRKGASESIKKGLGTSTIHGCKRNARERTRVHAVNQAFVALKFHLPAVRCNAKRVSKLKILRAAINYITALTDLLRGNSDFPKVNASSYCCDNTLTVSTRPKRESQGRGKESARIKSEPNQRQQHVAPQKIHDAAQSYNKQYWLDNHPLSN